MTAKQMFSEQANIYALYIFDPERPTAVQVLHALKNIAFGERCRIELARRLAERRAREELV